MDDEQPVRPTTNKPLNARERPKVWPLLAVGGLFLLLVAIFGILTLLRYTT